MNPNLKISQKGKLEVKSKTKVTQRNLSRVYTPGVADVVRAIMKDQKKVYDYTWKSRSVAVVSDGSAILGLGNQGPYAALPVMEAKAALFKELGGVDTVPIVLDTQDPQEIINIVTAIAPGFGGINLEDISAPNCFVIEETLKKKLNIPVFHDDQHGTAIVVLAGLINALKLVKKDFSKVKVVVLGAGAAGIAISKLLLKSKVKNMILFDSKGPIYQGRKEGMNPAKAEISKKTNKEKFKGSLDEALTGADIFLGVSGPNMVKAKQIAKMNKDAIVFAMANPIPEIMPEEALKGGARIVATGRSDFPNQINNALAFPGIFKGALGTRATNISDEIKVRSAQVLAKLVKKPTEKKIVPAVMDQRAANAVAAVFK